MSPGRAAKNRRGRRALAGAFLLAVVVGVGVWWAWPARAWTLTLEASLDEVTPWESVELSAAIAPQGAARQPVRWVWVADGRLFSTDGPKVEWRSAEAGTHEVQVRAIAGNGTEHTARVEVAVRRKPYVEVGGRVVTAPPPPPPAEPGLPFQIADVWVEKSSVCQGEATRVRLTPADTRRDEKWLRPNIDGEQAWEISYVPALATPGLQRIHVSLIDDMLGRRMAESDAFVEVKDCIVPFPVFIRTRRVPPDPERIALEAVVMRGPEWQAWARRSSDDRTAIPSATAARYDWDFGDGSKSTSTVTRTDHRFPDEADRGSGRATDYPVRVDAFDDAGTKMGTGYATITLVNPFHELKRNGHALQLIAHVPPGPATTNDDGSRSVAVTLRNLDEVEAAHLTQLRLRLVGCDGKSVTQSAVDVSTAFATDTVAPRSTVAGTLTLSESTLGDACSVNVETAGTSAPGNLRVTGFFSLDTGKRPSVALDDRQAAAMRHVHDLLGDRSVISLQDIYELESAGKVPRGVLTPDPYAPRP